MDDEAWAALGAAIAREGREHEERAARRIAERALGALRSVLHGREGSEALIAKLAAELASVSAEEWSRAPWAGAEDELALHEVWQVLERTWAWADDEGREELVPQLEADLAEVDAALRIALDAMPALREAVDAAPPFSRWPLRPVGSARDVHAEAIAQIEARTGIPRSEMLQPEELEDEDVFALEGEAHAAEDLRAALVRRAAWSRALHALGDHLPEQMRAPD